MKMRLCLLIGWMTLASGNLTLMPCYADEKLDLEGILKRWGTKGCDIICKPEHCKKSGLAKELCSKHCGHMNLDPACKASSEEKGEQVPIRDTGPDNIPGVPGPRNSSIEIGEGGPD